MKETNQNDIYYTIGEYVAYFNRSNQMMPFEDANIIKLIAAEIAERDNIRVKERHGSKITARAKTIALPKNIWEDAFNQFNQKPTQ